ncbi:MAG: nitronate monooxygenase [Candidatus Paceibacterota bacterium]|jgi:nitronate monooxygenase
MKNSMSQPIIQGGMGFNISSWPLARTISMLGQRGTIAGTALERVMAEILRRGDLDGHFRRALAHFPFPHIADQVIDAFYVEGGIDNDASRATPVWSINPSKLLISLTVCANYACVWLAKEGHEYPISINYLEKIAIPHIYAITGAMLAGVDFVTMGAGIPLQIPEVLKAVAEHRTATYRLPVVGKNITSHTMSFDPRIFFGEKLPEMKRPGFLPIISSNLLGLIFTDPRRISEGSVQGLVIEEPTAGGHNAPPRRPPDYGEKDIVDYNKIADLGLPFWIGGSYASPEKLKWAQSVGATGIQVGTIFALCNESEMRPDIKARVRQLGFEGKLKVRTDMLFSPSGYPFKVAILDGTVAIPTVYEKRERLCIHGALLTLFERPDGSIGYRCPSEPTARFVEKGGSVGETEGRGCICAGLYATAGLSDGEPPVVTLGDNVSFLRRIMASAISSYSAEDAVRYLLSR